MNIKEMTNEGLIDVINHTTYLQGLGKATEVLELLRRLEEGQKAIEELAILKYSKLARKETGG